MRKIGTLPSHELGSRFVDYLLTLDIASEVSDKQGTKADIWILDEDQVEEAKQLLSAFLADPNSQEYVDASALAEEKRKSEKRAQQAFAKQVFDRKRISRRALFTRNPVTRILIVLSILATVFGGLGNHSGLTQWLSITAYRFDEGQFLFRPGLPEIFSGQLWRLLTPIFLHASLTSDGLGILHLLFNMLWLSDLGGMLEAAEGRIGLLKKVVIFGVVSNVFQYIISGPAFGGMSGVVFGLLGYCWLRGKLDVTSGLFVSPHVMLMMTFWFFLGFSGGMGPIANAAHAGGLVLGLAWGYISVYYGKLGMK
jgi:GlpG protein